VVAEPLDVVGICPQLLLVGNLRSALGGRDRSELWTKGVARNVASRLCDARDVDDATLVRRYQDEGDAQALDAIILRYRTFAKVKARSYFLIGGDRDDVEQEALIGLYKAIRDFRPGHDVHFRGFAELCIRRQIITAIKAATRQKHQPLNGYLSISPSERADDPEAPPIERSLVCHADTDPADAVVASEQRIATRDQLGSVLSALEHRVVELYLDGRTYDEMSDSLGRHTKAIDNALQRIKRKLGGGDRRDATGRRSLLGDDDLAAFSPPASVA
jgi:RNA polymerase sporulation-specific sigma factor